MIRVVLTMTVPAANAEAFESAWQGAAEYAGRRPGCLAQTLGRQAGDELVYHVSSEWTDLDTFRSFERSAGQDEATAGLRRLRSSARMEWYEVVETV
jgi:heme-degrading monooxygenase HmoA